MLTCAARLTASLMLRQTLPSCAAAAQQLLLSLSRARCRLQELSCRMLHHDLGRKGDVTHHNLPQVPACLLC